MNTHLPTPEREQLVMRKWTTLYPCLFVPRQPINRCTYAGQDYQARDNSAQLSVLLCSMQRVLILTRSD
jgi:hypothetical protein